MERGELHRATPHPQDPRRIRIFLVVSRPELIQSNYSTVICAPVYSTRSGLASELEVDEREGLVFFVMAYVQGDNLAQRIHKRGAMDPV